MLHADDATIHADTARSMAHHRAVYDCMGTGYAVVDAAGRIAAATDRMTRMLAAAPADVHGQSFARFVAAADQETYFQQLAAAQQHGTTIAAVTLQHANGQHQQVFLHMLAWLSNGTTQWLIGLLGPAAPPATPSASQHAHKAEAMRELVHHINNRLMVINTSSELISMLVDKHTTGGAFDDAETQRRTHAITRATEEAAAALQRLITLANAPSSH